MGSPALDFHCCYKGKAFFIETKAGNKQPTPRQETTISEIKKADGTVFIVNELTGLEELKEWLM